MQPKADEQRGLARLFRDVANKTSLLAARASTFAIASAVGIIWAVTGPLFGYSDRWQHVINTGTTFVTFLMVFFIQNSQNREGAAIQVSSMSSSERVQRTTRS